VVGKKIKDVKIIFSSSIEYGARNVILVDSRGVVHRGRTDLTPVKRETLEITNPDNGIWPDDAREAGAAVVGTGRSDFPNQINNSLAFPGVFRGALDARATRITTRMKLAAAEALAGLVAEPTPAVAPAWQVEQMA
jgi:malate dehydrogenase (oxaloacetate-decarboxylating)